MRQKFALPGTAFRQLLDAAEKCKRIGSNEILLLILALFFVYIVAAMFAAEGWVIYRLVTRRPVLPVQPLVSRRDVPWGIWTILLTFVMWLFANFACQFGYAKLIGRKPASPGTPPAAASKPEAKSFPPTQIASTDPKTADPTAKPLKPQPAEEPKPANPDVKQHAVAVSEASSDAVDSWPSFTEAMALNTVFDTILLILLPLLLCATSPTPLRDLGLSFKRWWLQAAVGMIALLAAAPVLYGLQFGMMRIWESRAHPLQKMVLDEYAPGVVQLAILTAVIVAPLCEEMMFRGILQSWLVRLGPRRRRDLKPVLVETLAINSIDSSIPVAPWTSESEQWSPDDVDPKISDAPALAPEDSPEPPRSGLAGIVLTSLIFAGVHAAQWPAPIAIFVLSVVIGCVYHRTGSLIAAVCMHATFNGLATLTLLGSLLAPQTTHRPKPTPGHAPASIASFSNGKDNACIDRGK